MKYNTKQSAENSIDPSRITVKNILFPTYKKTLSF